MEIIKPYEKYKDSSVAWLGEIPEHWEVSKIKWLTPVRRGASPRPIDNPIYFNEYGEFSWVRIADVSASKRYLLKTKEKLSDLGASLSVQQYPNDLFLSIAGTVGKPIITKIKCCIHDGFVYFPNLKINNEYLFYIFITGIPYKGLGKMGTQLNLNTETVGSISIPLPSMPEIKKIVNFLNYKTAKIERFIFKKKRLIKLLNEQKAGIINDAVTKGLDANAKMKPSGIEWLGDIPEHWEVKRLRFLLKSGDKGIKIGPFGSAIKSDIINSKEYFDSLNLKSYKVYGQEHPIASDFNIGNKYINEYNYENLRNYKLSVGDIVISMMGTIGKSKVVPDNIEEGIMDSHLIRIGVNLEISSKYVSFLINDSVALLTNMKYESKGSIMSGLNSKIIKSLYIPLPKTKEQNEILDYIKKETATIHKTIATIEKEIALVQEYRTALIAEAVTGKIDVRDYKVPVLGEQDLVTEYLEEEMDLVGEEGENEDNSNL